MTNMNSIKLDLFPESYRSIFVGIDVKNRNIYFKTFKINDSAEPFQLSKEQKDIHYIFLDLSKVISVHQLEVAISKVLFKQKFNRRFITHDIHREIVYSLSGSRNMQENFNYHFIQPTAQHLCVISVNPTPEIINEIEQFLCEKRVEFFELESNIIPKAKEEEESLKKFFDINENEMTVGTLEENILNHMNMRDI